MREQLHRLVIAIQYLPQNEVYIFIFGLVKSKDGILQQGVPVRQKQAVNRGRLSVIGKYLDDALLLANMSQSELARRAGFRSSSYLSRVMKGERDIDRATLLHWCHILNCPDWLEERILNATGYASERQQRAVEAEDVVEQTHQAVLEEVAKHEREDEDA